MENLSPGRWLNMRLRTLLRGFRDTACQSARSARLRLGSNPLTAVVVVAAALSLSGCATPQGAGDSTAPLFKPLSISTSAVTDIFSPQMRELKKDVEAADYDAAEALLLKEAEYFEQRLSSQDHALTPELTLLRDHLWVAQYQSRFQQAIQQLSAVNSVLDKTQWPRLSGQFEAARKVFNAANEDDAVRMLRAGAEPREALDKQLRRIAALAVASRSAALALTFEHTLATATHETTYPAAPFEANDYRDSATFQTRLLEHVLAASPLDRLKERAVKFTAYLSGASKSSIDKRYLELVKQQFLADSRISLDELSLLAVVKAPFGGGGDALSKMVRVGYVDLTSASFKNRNIFDFEISFRRDLPLSFVPADESVFSSVDLSGYDYIFVTDLAVAKVSRLFKSRNPVHSRVQTGSREEPNPAYVTALTNYQKAMTEYQRAQLSAALPKACVGFACALQGLADGIAQGTARRGVDEASATLAHTSQSLTTPVYSPYIYESVDINTTKTADVNYFVIDVKGRQVLRNNFQLTDHEAFNVAYNVRDEDPDRTSILRNVKSEEEVTTWEKRPLEVSLAALFNADSIRTARTEPFASMPSFLASLTTRAAVTASPTYVDTSARRVSVGLAAAQQSSEKPVAIAQTIADERFDSIVIVQNPKSEGAGFYVTPELVLTAYHVVQGSELVQMTFYDGTKTFGRVVDHDIRLDLALIRAQTTGKPLPIHSGPLRLGETVEAIGHPKGYAFTITRGVISAIRRQRSAMIGSDALVEFVQTDTPISPGNSGGPLLRGGAVIGVNDWIRVDKGSQNLNFSVSYNEIRSFLDRYTSR